MSNPLFNNPLTNPFGLTDVGDSVHPTFVDIDGDGDLDAFVGERYGNTVFFLNDVAPTITAAAQVGTLTEDDNAANAASSITLTKADVNAGDSANYDTSYLILNNGWSTNNNGLSYSKTGTYGTATLTLANNVVSYVLNNSDSATQALNLNQTANDSFTVQVIDHNGMTASTDAVFTITGANDAASISGTTTGAVTENTGTQVTGTLTVSDVDTGDAVFNTTPVIAATYGTFALNSAGDWTYALDNAHVTVNALVANATLTDNIIVTSVDGTATQAISIQIMGANDAASISGTATGAVTENTNTQVIGTLVVSDVDTGEAIFNTTPIVAASYGTFAITSTGVWKYNLNNSNASVNALAAGASLADHITVTSIDGTAT